MRIKLNKITLENFKCFPHKEVILAGDNALVRGENGSGKTTLGPDAINWLLFGKNSLGVTKFKNRPIVTDEDSPDYEKPIKGLVVAVEMDLQINGVTRTLRRAEKEVITNKKVTGFTSDYWIDEVPQKPQRLFHDFVKETIPVDKFRMLTDLDYFNNDKKNPPDERRNTLCDMAGAVAEPQNINAENLRSTLNGKTVKELEKVLKDRRIKYKEEQEEIPIILNEKHREIDEIGPIGSTEGQEVARDECKKKIAGKETERTLLRNSETERNGHVEHINRLTNERGHRENIVKNQSGPVDDLLQEKAELEKAYTDQSLGLVDLQSEIRMTNAEIGARRNELEKHIQTRTTVYEEYQEKDFTNCPTCKQLWPEDLSKPGKDEAEERGLRLKQIIAECSANLGAWQDKHNKLLAEEKVKANELKTAEEAKNKRIAEINEAIENKPEVDPATDPEWQKIDAEIKVAQEKLGKPVTEQLGTIENEIKTANSELTKLNECLAQADTIKKAKARITELEARLKELGQIIAALDGELEAINQFHADQNTLIKEAVNGMFEHVTFKLFDYYLNEGYKPCCVCLLNGKPYPDISKGEKKFANIDVRNTLSDYYGVEVPLFVDDAGDLTMPIEANSQVIELEATIKYVCKECTIVTYTRKPITECSYCKSNHVEKQEGIEIIVEQEAGKAVA